MEDWEDLKSILPYLPVMFRSSSLFWPPQVVETLKALSRGLEHSGVKSGAILFRAISDLRRSLSLARFPELLAFSAADGYALFFDDLISPDVAAKWLGQIVPALANLLLRLPSLLEAHYQNSDVLVTCSGGRERVKTVLRLLGSQEPGIVFLSQELIGALLGCSFFCLFPISNRGAKHLPAINFDHLFANLYNSYSPKQGHKIRCIMHYFERICSSMPVGVVSFERKVLPLECSPLCVGYPEADAWSKSLLPLCHFEAYPSGFIEDQSHEALEVDFANKYLGGGALHSGCVQEEIRFMINPELIAGMLFLPSMADNEAIEVVGAERFSNYTGYASTFRFSGDCVDKRDLDVMRRRKTRIIAIDALDSPGTRQFGLECLLRDVNKSFCGFLDGSKCQQHHRLFQDDGFCGFHTNSDMKGSLVSVSPNSQVLHETSRILSELHKEISSYEVKGTIYQGHQDAIGIATGNWGCGAFGGDPELKATIQWLAASQALRPFILYYTFGVRALENINQVSRWILSHGWTVGELWNMLVEYSSQRLKGETSVGFFSWLLPSLSLPSDVTMLDVLETP